jgi:hypothetical protein
LNNPNLVKLLLQSGIGTQCGRNPHSWHGLAEHTEVMKAAVCRPVVNLMVNPTVKPSI